MVELEPNQRKELAEALRRTRSRDKVSLAAKRGPGFYENDRGIEAYINVLVGLGEFLNFVRGVEGSDTVLDVGAGTTRGSAELQRSHLGRQLKFKATTLTYNPVINEHLGMKNTKIAPVETLKGIEDQSIAGIIGLNSIAYTRYPHLAVAAMDRVLVPGGAFKATFERFNDELGMKDERLFSVYFMGKGYDVAIHGSGLHRVMVGIKPGSDQQATARDLVQSDKMNEMAQRRFVALEAISNL